MREITQSEIEQYERDGAVCLRGMFDQKWVDSIRIAIDRVLQTKRGKRADLTAPDEPGRYNNCSMMWSFDPDFHAFVLESPAGEIARQIMRSRTIRFYYDHLFVMEPGTTQITPWHTDQPYWLVRGEQICSVWLALDTVTKETGRLEYIKGSHRWQNRYRPVFGNGAEEWRFAGLQDPQEAEEIPDIDANRDKYEFLSWDVEPGDCLVHHSLAIHGSAGNLSVIQRRRAHSTRWLGDDAIYTQTPGSFLKAVGSAVTARRKS